MIKILEYIFQIIELMQLPDLNLIQKSYQVHTQIAQ